MTIILSLVVWTEIARGARQDHQPARGGLRGRGPHRRRADQRHPAAPSCCAILLRHPAAPSCCAILLPGFLSYLILSLTLAVPQMILAETAPSFLGLGLQPPAISWGVLQQDMQAIRSIALQP